MQAIEAEFQRLKSKKEGAFIAFITCGDPTPEATVQLAERLIDSGTDILELGIPYSDPVADGPTIQASYYTALKQGMTSKSAFNIVQQIKAKRSTPIALLTYYNVVLQRGIDAFFKEASHAGANGIIIPDLPIEEAAAPLKAAEENSMDLVFLIAPTTQEERLLRILKVARGFIYLVSLLGVTGARSALSDVTRETVTRITRHTRGRIPVAVGFGISRPEHVVEVLNAGADGVIVGSAILDLVSRHGEDFTRALDFVGQYVHTMKAATREVQREKRS